MLIPLYFFNYRSHFGSRIRHITLFNMLRSNTNIQHTTPNILPITSCDLPIPPPSALPQWMAPWTLTPYPSFTFEGSRIMWVFSPFSFYDWTIIDLTTNDLWQGIEQPPPPPPLEMNISGGIVCWIKKSQRWVWYPWHPVSETEFDI